MACKCTKNTFKESLYIRQMAAKKKAELEEKKKEKDAGSNVNDTTSKSK